MTLLSALPWPGNLDELRGSVTRLVAMAASRSVDLEDVLEHLRRDATVVPSQRLEPVPQARQLALPVARTIC